MRKTWFFVILIFSQSCFNFKENPLDPTTPTGMLIKILSEQSSSESSDGSPDGSSGGSAPQQLKIYITASSGNGNIAGWFYPGSNVIEKADNACNSDSNKPDSNSYKAMIVDGAFRQACVTSNCTNPAENIDWVFKPNTDYYRVDGTYLFTTNSAGIVLGAINQITSSSSDFYWTGLGADWTNSSWNCSNWFDDTWYNSGIIGSGTAIDYRWYNDSTFTCDNSVKLLCVEQ